MGQRTLDGKADADWKQWDLASHSAALPLGISSSFCFSIFFPPSEPLFIFPSLNLSPTLAPLNTAGIRILQ